MRVLYLDDERDPTSFHIKETFPENAEIHLVRTMREMADWIDANGVPDMFSFDYYLTNTDPLRNGADCASYAAFMIDRMGKEMPTTRVHSSLFEAADKVEEHIRFVFKDFKVDRATG